MKPEDYALKMARALNLPIPQMRARLATILADPELRHAREYVLQQLEEPTIVTDVRRNASTNQIEVLVAADPGLGAKPSPLSKVPMRHVSRVLGELDIPTANLLEMREQIARMELEALFGKPKTAFLGLFYVRP